MLKEKEDRIIWIGTTDIKRETAMIHMDKSGKIVSVSCSQLYVDILNCIEMNVPMEKCIIKFDRSNVYHFNLSKDKKKTMFDPVGIPLCLFPASLVLYKKRLFWRDIVLTKFFRLLSWKSI